MTVHTCGDCLFRNNKDYWHECLHPLASMMPQDRHNPQGIKNRWDNGIECPVFENMDQMLMAERVKAARQWRLQVFESDAATFRNIELRFCRDCEHYNTGLNHGRCSVPYRAYEELFRIHDPADTCNDWTPSEAYKEAHAVELAEAKAANATTEEGAE